MAIKKTKHELTWIGKENRSKLEPRILIEDPEKSYHAAQRHSENDIFDNRLIFGDNLLARKALEKLSAFTAICISLKTYRVLEGIVTRFSRSMCKYLNGAISVFKQTQTAVY